MLSRKMSKSVVLAALLMTALPVLAFAQTSRLEGMTLQGDYVKDYTAIYTYPSQVPNVGNLVYGELGNTGGVGTAVADRSVGAILGNLFDGRFGTWAIHLRQITPNLGQGDVVSSPTSGTIGGDPNVNGNEEFDVMWGRKTGTMSIGLRLNRSFWGQETNLPAVQTTLNRDPLGFAVTGDENLSRNIMGFGGGVGFEMNPNTSVDVALLYQSRTFENTTSPIGVATNTKEDNGTTYVLSGRAMWQYQSNVVVTPVFKYYSYDLSRQETVGAGTPQSFDNTIKGWQLGAAGNWSLGSNDLFVLGLDFVSNKVEQSDALFGTAANDSTDITENMFPRVFMALETHVNSWLTIRTGASKGAFTKVKFEPRNNPSKAKVETTSTSFDMNIGCGVKLGTLQLDAVLADNAFQFSNGLLGGTSPTGGFFPKVTATYSF
jgi:hypothetical protein